ncbi:MAG TPA: FAD-dependent oxidoreductase, partial [Clostridia bacterium]|nr:FAD-dependent oxidoreductase [Clostridia bacterium]
MESQDKLYDIAIIGCGPAGLSAAINGLIRNKELIILGGDFCTNRLYLAPKVDNYLGFWEISGKDLREKFLAHAREMGVQIEQAKVDRVYALGEEFGIMAKDKYYRAKTVILATGVSTAKYLPGEEELLGKGVGYCATCDGPLYRDKKVAVIGYSQEEAEQEANFLAELCSAVYYIPMYQEEPEKLVPKVEIIRKNPKEIAGQEVISKLVFEDGEEIAVDGLFIIREMVPTNQLVPGLELEDGAIKVNRRMETNISGLFAAGD